MSEQVSELPLPGQGHWSLFCGCFWRALAAMASGAVVAYVMSFFAIISGYISLKHAGAREISFFQLAVVLSILASAATYLFFDRKDLQGRIRQLLPELAAGMRRPASLLIVLCVPLGVIGTIHWGMTAPPITKDYLHDAPSIYWVGIAASIILVGPFSEEVFYRGFVWEHLSKAMSPGTVGTISAALFLGSHIFNGLLAPVFVLPLAIILTMLRMRGIGLGMCILAHAIYNATIILGNFAQTHSELFRAPA